jgi:hypothetical protein
VISLSNWKWQTWSTDMPIRAQDFGTVLSAFRYRSVGVSDREHSLTRRPSPGSIAPAKCWPAFYGDLALSPDGQSAAVSGAGDLWLLDLRRDGLATRFTFGTGLDRNPGVVSRWKQVVYIGPQWRHL